MNSFTCTINNSSVSKQLLRSRLKSDKCSTSWPSCDTHEDVLHGPRSGGLHEVLQACGTCIGMAGGGMYPKPLSLAFRGSLAHHPAAADMCATGILEHQESSTEMDWPGGDVHKYLLVPVTIQFWGQKHRLEAAVSPHITYPLVLWTGFQTLVLEMFVDMSYSSKTWCGICTSSGVELVPGPSTSVLCQGDTLHRDFSLEKSYNETLRHTFELVRVIDGKQLVKKHPDECFTILSIFFSY